jgi:glyceraldehyde-3-phosphate dehydrogenase (NAD(P))
MRVVGITKTRPDYRLKLAVEDRNYNFFVPDENLAKLFTDAGIPVSGDLDDLVDESDVILDATPEGEGAKNKAVYLRHGKKAIFQGGEEDEVAGLSFVAQCNFDEAKGGEFLRVVSCNTTALCRVLHSLDQRFGISKARVVIARRAADPDEVSKGPIDAVALDPATVPSHHGPDVNTVLRNFPVISMAIKIPTTHMHLHSLIVTVRDNSVSSQKVVEQLMMTPRVITVSGKDGFKSTAHVIDYARELGRSRNDLYEAAVWKESATAIENEVYFFMAVHQESIVIPENIDAVRALFGGYNKEESISMTNKTLGILGPTAYSSMQRKEEKIVASARPTI